MTSVDVHSEPVEQRNVLKVSNYAEWVLSVLSDHCKVHMVVEEVEMEVMLCL